MPEEEVLIATVSGPRGDASIYKVTLQSNGSIEVEYAVLCGPVRQAFPSMGEAHLAADELAGNE